MPVIKTRFKQAICQACVLGPLCTTSQTGRSLQFFLQPVQAALTHARQHQQTAAFQDQYKRRAGIEGTISAAKRVAGLERARYIGLAKTHLQGVFTAVASNLWRWYAFIQGEPLAQHTNNRF